MSDDEYEMEGKLRRHPAIYKSFRPAWRSVDLGNFLHALDDLYREDWGRGKTVAGNPPRTRIEDRIAASGAVPKGLWRNCYDEEWLKAQRPYFVNELEIIDSDFDLDIPLA